MALTRKEALLSQRLFNLRSATTPDAFNELWDAVDLSFGELETDYRKLWSSTDVLSSLCAILDDETLEDWARKRAHELLEQALQCEKASAREFIVGCLYGIPAPGQRRKTTQARAKYVGLLAPLISEEWIRKAVISFLGSDPLDKTVIAEVSSVLALIAGESDIEIRLEHQLTLRRRVNHDSQGNIRDNREEIEALVEHGGAWIKASLDSPQIRAAIEDLLLAGNIFSEAVRCMLLGYLGLRPRETVSTLVFMTSEAAGNDNVRKLARTLLGAAYAEDDFVRDSVSKLWGTNDYHLSLYRVVVANLRFSEAQNLIFEALTIDSPQFQRNLIQAIGNANGFSDGSIARIAFWALCEKQSICGQEQLLAEVMARSSRIDRLAVFDMIGFLQNYQESRRTDEGEYLNRVRARLALALNGMCGIEADRSSTRDDVVTALAKLAVDESVGYFVRGAAVRGICRAPDNILARRSLLKVAQSDLVCPEIQGEAVGAIVGGAPDHFGLLDVLVKSSFEHPNPSRSQGLLATLHGMLDGAGERRTKLLREMVSILPLVIKRGIGSLAKEEFSQFLQDVVSSTEELSARSRSVVADCFAEAQLAACKLRDEIGVQHVQSLVRTDRTLYQLFVHRLAQTAERWLLVLRLFFREEPKQVGEENS